MAAPEVSRGLREGFGPGPEPLTEAAAPRPSGRSGRTHRRVDGGAAAPATGGIIAAMLQALRAMPGGVRIFLGYAFLILGLIGVSLRWVIDQAISAPISGPGVVVMVLLAYTIFTTTLVIQRKEASRALALGLVDPDAARRAAAAARPRSRSPPSFVGVLAVLLFFGLTRPEVRTWLNEP